MKEATYLIVGGGIAGTTAAETIRQRDPKGSVVIVSDEPYRLYSRILLSKPNFFLERIPFNQIWLKKEPWYADNRIEFIGGRSAVRLDTGKKVVGLDNGEELGYQKLLLATGGCARKWGTADSDKAGIFYLRTLDDAKSIISVVKSSKRAVVVGGGFIGFEMCEMLRLAGIEVTLVIRESHYWDPLLDEKSGRIIEKALEGGGIKILRSAEIEKILGEEKIRGVVLKDKTELPCDFIIVGIGVICPFAWVESAGVAVGRGIQANEYLETNTPDIWTAGDAAEYNDLILGEQVQLGNWVNAQMQGRAVGLNMAASFDELRVKKEPFRKVSFYTTQGFGITIAFVGDVRPLPDRIVIVRGSSDSGSYGRITLKDGEIIGATLINRTAEVSAIAKLIEKDMKVAGREQELGNTAFDLKNLL